MNKYLSVEQNAKLNKISEELNTSEMIVQHSLSCLITKMMRGSELKKKLVFALSETSMREALHSLVDKQLVNKVVIAQKTYYGLTPDGSVISPFVKKLLYAQQSQPVLF